MTIPFSKYSGCGNDFILIDQRSFEFEKVWPASIVALCQRQTGIGADGLIFLENSSVADFRMRIFNADGSEAEMCGNGLRCLAKMIMEEGFSKTSFLIETMLQNISIHVINECIQIKMATPKNLKFGLPLSIDGHLFTLHYLEVGVPHTLIFVDNIEECHWLKMAPQIRFHPDFQPHGTNVNFVQIETDQTLLVRTYERGVETETLACGTGAIAAAFGAAKIYHLPFPMRVKPRSGEILTIFVDETDALTGTSLTGPAKKNFQGSFSAQQFGFQLKSTLLFR